MRKLLKIIGTVFFGLIIIVGITGYFFVKNFDLNKYKSYASDFVEKETGRKLAINGNASVGISLIPTLVIEDVELSNAPWASNPQMVKVQKLELKFALIPLLSKEVVIDKIVLINPQVYLEVAKDGKANWDFSASAPKTIAFENRYDFSLVSSAYAQETASVPAAANASPLGALAGFTAKSIIIQDGFVQYHDQKSGAPINLTINELSLSAPSLDEDMNAKFDVVFDKQNISGTMTVGSLNSLLAGKNPYNVSLAAKAYGIDLGLAGGINDVMKNPSFAANINIYNPAGNFDAPEVTLKTYVTGDQNVVNADINLLNIVNNMITGKVKVDISGKVPFINADLNSDLINLNNFSQTSNFAFELPALISEAQALEMVPDTAIPYADMYAVNANANLNIKKLIIDNAVQADNVALKASLQNGVLNVSKLKLNFGGGELAVNGVVNAGAKTMQLNIASQNMSLQNLHKEFLVSGKGDFGVLSGGNLDITANLKGSGNTYRQMVQSLDGQAIAIVDKSVIQTGNMEFLTGNFITSLLNVLPLPKKSSQEVDLTCAVVRADFKDGKAEFPKGIAVQSKQLSLVSDGKINLINDKIDFSLRPFSGKVVDANVAQALSSFIKIKGTLEAPKVTIDDKQALKAIVGVAATGGTAYLGSQLVLDADSSPCYTALRGTAFQSRFPAPNKVEQAGKDVYEDTTKQIKKDIKDLKNTAKDFLKGLKGL